jgi:hypothetical protein
VKGRVAAVGWLVGGGEGELVLVGVDGWWLGRGVVYDTAGLEGVGSVLSGWNSRRMSVCERDLRLVSTEGCERARICEIGRPVRGVRQHGERPAVELIESGHAVEVSGKVLSCKVRDLSGDEEGNKAANVEGAVIGGGGGPQFQTASSDDSRVFFTDPERLTEDSTAESPTPTGGDLYVYEEASRKVTDLTVDHNASESAEVQGTVPGAGEDGSAVYFVARGVLSTAPNAEGASPVAGSENLYVVERAGAGWGAPKFIAALSSDDRPDWGGEEEASSNLGRLTARSSPNGRYFTFMSQRSLTGYDNRDVSPGAPRDAEVYLFDAASGRLECASCRPSGARPHGVFDPAGNVSPGLLVDRRRSWEERWLAASVPGWTTQSVVLAPYQSRYLSDSGRMFFNATDGLVPQDTNKVMDVYQYEPPGVGSCSTKSTTYSSSSAGCVNLISSGGSKEESAFLDASENGNEAFFLTG